MKRPLCILAVIFLLHTGVVLFVSPLWGPIFPLAGLGLGFLWQAVHKNGRVVAFVLVSALGSLLSLLAIQAYQSRLQQGHLLQGQELTVQGYVTEVGPHNPHTITVLASLPTRGNRVLRLSIHAEDIQAGDCISGRFRITGLRQDGRSYLLSGGLTLYGHQVGTLTLFHPPKEPWLWKAMHLRIRLQHQIRTAVPGETGCLLSGMLFSSRTGISDDMKYRLNDAGLGHLFSVSGLHMSILVGFLSRLGRKLRLGRWSLLLCAAGIGAMVFSAGFSTSVLRAAVMTSLYLIGQAVNRQIDSFTSLGLAALIISLFYPPALSELGFQLSFAATLSISLFATPLTRWAKNRWIGRFGSASNTVTVAAEAMGVTMAAQLGVLPILGFREGYLPTYALAANLLATPFVLGAITLGLGGVVLLLARLDVVGGWLLSLATLPVRGIAGIAQLFWMFPFGRIPTFFAWQRWLVVGGMCIALVALVIRQRGPRRRLLQLWLVLTLLVGTFCAVAQHNQTFILTNPESKAMAISRRGQTVIVYDHATQNEYSTRMLNQMLIRANLGQPDRLLTIPGEQISPAQSLLLSEDILAEFPCPYTTLINASGIKVLKFGAGYDIINQHSAPFLWEQADILVDMDWNLYANHPHIAITRRQDGDQFAALPQRPAQ